MNTNRIYLGISILVFAHLPGLMPMQDQLETKTSQSTFMQRKLDYNKEIIAGLAMEDFDRIRKASQDLMLLSHESNWKAVNSPDYLKASSDFRETVQRLREAGDQKNLDGATIAYLEVTLNCVRCHKQLRSKWANEPKLKYKRSK